MRWPVRVDRRRRLWRGWGVCGTRSRSSRVDGVPPGLACLGLPRLLSLPRLPRLPRLGKTLLPPVVRRRRSEGGPPAGRPQRRLPRSEDRCRRVDRPGCCRPGCCSHGRLARRHRRERGVGRPGYRCRRLRAEPVPRRRRLRMAEPVPRRRLCRLTVPVSRDVRLAVWGSRRVSAIQLTIGVPRWLYSLAVPVPLRVGGLQRRVWRGLRRGGRVGGWRVEAVCRLQRLCSLISRHPPPPPPLALRRGRLLLRRWRVHLRRPLPRCLIGA